ncbi:cobyric acid synthase [Fulvivirga ulvae]|uniref:cobyric acid synthase n=1 Tax=Fulvivirga ulvae TaxID=2904245 RepID=UPI001F1B8CB2|nr:cobyric acid synthase [Fulvivirga ulvae]UII34004.1 cobyric acid synthase [Fulvivirga ulvae]
MTDNLRPLMFVGTGSDVGKSILCAGICRILKQDGYQPAPFKGQNMSNNSYATPDGKEIGRAQAVQADAAGLPPHTDMNPILLKPNSDQTSQLVINGKPAGNQSALSYFRQTDRDKLFDIVMEAFNRLNQRYAPVVIEGAGSISELNLKARDITNMRVALKANAATYLIADIDRGGVFGSIYGTLELLTAEERKLIKGIIINKFRGDIRLFEDGKRILEEITGVPVVGVVPYFKDIHIEEEDAVTIVNKNFSSKAMVINVAVVLLSRMSNFTDFNALERDPRIHLYYTDKPEELKEADIIIIPGTKSTLGDLQEIRKKGLVKEILSAYTKGKKVVGVCGGYQMLGQEIHDPDGVEGVTSAIPGIGLLPVSTTMLGNKTTEQVSFNFLSSTKDCSGYEIHMGETAVLEGSSQPVNQIRNGKTDGFYLNDKCWGTYIHGIFDNPVVVDHLLSGLDVTEVKLQSHQEYKEEQFDKLASLLRECMDIDYIKSTVTSPVLHEHQEERDR